MYNRTKVQSLLKVDIINYCVRHNVNFVVYIVMNYIMCYNREQASRAVRPGWNKLINEFYDELDKWNSEESNFNAKVLVHQVKQKYGSLRIYFSPQIPHLDQLYAKLNKESSTICEICGNNGTYCDKKFWMYVLCEKHALCDEDNFYDDYDEDYDT